MSRITFRVPPELLEKYESTLVRLISENAPAEKVSMAYAEVVYLRLGCNKVQTAQQLAVDRRTIHRWLGDSAIEAEVRRARLVAMSGASHNGEPVRVIGVDPDDENKTVIQDGTKNFRSVLTSELAIPGLGDNST